MFRYKIKLRTEIFTVEKRILHILHIPFNVSENELPKDSDLSI